MYTIFSSLYSRMLHIFDFLERIVATSSLWNRFFSFVWNAWNHFCNRTFPWRLKRRTYWICRGAQIYNNLRYRQSLSYSYRTDHIDLSSKNKTVRSKFSWLTRIAHAYKFLGPGSEWVGLVLQGSLENAVSTCTCVFLSCDLHSECVRRFVKELRWEFILRSVCGESKKQSCKRAPIQASASFQKWRSTGSRRILQLRRPISEWVLYDYPLKVVYVGLVA